MSLIAELKRRKVFKVGAAYLVVGWLLIQVASTLAPQLNLPEWAPRLATFVILLGFPITLLLAWVFEVGAEGIKVDVATVGNKRMLLIAAVLAAIAVGWYWKTRPAPVTGDDANARSIAVLPFVNMSEDKGNEYFSDGISEEILNVLARTPDLHVAARTSSFSFKGEKKEVPEIARELKVRMVLEGSVRKQAERVRVTAQLIDASNGYHVWSQTFDRDLKDIFAIQDEIASAIAQELKVKLTGEHSGGTDIPNTQDMQAYDLYLQGLALWQQRGEKGLREAEKAFRAALARDPEFAKAWAGLALAYVTLPDWSDAPLVEYHALASDAAQHALALDRDLPEPYAVLGYIAFSNRRFATGRAMFKRSLALGPSYATGHQWFGESLLMEGDLEASLLMAKKAVDVDPKSLVARNAYANSLLTAGRDDEARTVCAEIATAWEPCLLVAFEVAVLHKDYDTARTSLEHMAASRGDEAIELAREMGAALGHETNPGDLAQRVLDMPDGGLHPDSPTPLAHYDVMIWLMAVGRNDLAAERFVRFVREQPHIARETAFDVHLAVLHCDLKVQEALRSLKVEEPHLAAPCKAVH